MTRIVCSVVVLVCCAVVLAGCGATQSVMVEVSKAQSVNLTNETRAKIKEGMTLDEMNAAVAPLLGQSGMIANVKEDLVYELGWHDPKTKKAIVVKFKGSRVTGTSAVNLP